MTALPETIEGLPNICGAEATVAEAVAAGKEKQLSASAGAVDFGSIRAASAIALHQHQPLDLVVRSRYRNQQLTTVCRATPEPGGGFRLTKTNASGETP